MFSECGKDHDCALKTLDACCVLDLPALSAQNVKYGDASILGANTEHFKLFSVRTSTPNTFQAFEFRKILVDYNSWAIHWNED